MPRVLLVDDDTELASLLVEYLNQDGFDADAVHDGESGVEAALSGHYSLVVLDVMMPRMNGVEALRAIRAASRIPVLMLTARGDDIDRILGLELGADDYVPKPCTPRELSARIRAILRRLDERGEAAADVEALRNGPLVLWPQRRAAQWQGEALALTGTEFSLLEVLVRRVGHVVSKAELSDKALGRPLARFDRSIDVHVSAIRQKLGNAADGQSWIRTVRGVGYQLVRE
ncbi:response regulator [Niveibacterium terrae]|uniref:response regulator n=1 Tax=Niveibacterium terrae TaxID=3373598 RepID=UPI003A8DA555